MKEKLKLTPLEKSWILYDIGNSAFTLLASTLIQIFFTDLADSCGVDPTYQLSCWAFAGSISTIIVAIIAPICGTLSDRKYKKPIFFFAVVLGSAGCALMGLTGHWMAYLVVFVIAKVGFSSSIVFYDSMLPEITTEERMDNISSMGYAFGYIGSVIPFVVCLVPLICAKFSLIPMRAASVTSALITAVW